MDGRSVWPDSFDSARDALAGADDGRTFRLVPSKSLIFLPYTVEGEELPAYFQFAREKARTLASWAAALGWRSGAGDLTGAIGHLARGRRAGDSGHPRRAP